MKKIYTFLAVFALALFAVTFDLSPARSPDVGKQTAAISHIITPDAIALTGEFKTAEVAANSRLPDRIGEKTDYYSAKHQYSASPRVKAILTMGNRIRDNPV